MIFYVAEKKTFFTGRTRKISSAHLARSGNQSGHIHSIHFILPSHGFNHISN